MTPDYKLTGMSLSGFTLTLGFEAPPWTEAHLHAPQSVITNLSGNVATVAAELRKTADKLDPPPPPPVARVIPLVVLEDDLNVSKTSSQEELRQIIVNNAADARRWRERKVPDTAHNLLTHREAWLEAVFDLSNTRGAYWKHEADALRETLDDLTQHFGMTVPRKPLPADVVALAKRVRVLGLLSKEVTDEEIERIINAVAES